MKARRAPVNRSVAACARWASLAAIAGLIALGCTGTLLEPEKGNAGASGNPEGNSPDGRIRPPGYGGEGNPLDVGFECNPNADPSPAPLKRLTVRQYENTLRDLLHVGAADGVVDSVSDALARLPIDGEEEESFPNMDGRLSQRHVDGYFAVADELSRAIAGDKARLLAIAGDCATAASVDPSCLRAFVVTFGRRALRRPLSEMEVARYVALNEPGVSAGEVYRGVIFSMLLAPQFLYHTFRLLTASDTGRCVVVMLRVKGEPHWAERLFVRGFDELTYREVAWPVGCNSFSAPIIFEKRNLNCTCWGSTGRTVVAVAWGSIG